MSLIRRLRGNRDLWLSVGLFVLTILSRLPFRSQILHHWDSVNFAYAMQEFDITKDQPHPPGYIAYVWLCRFVDRLFDDAQLTMVAISIVASGLAVVALFHLGRTMFNRRVGAIGALFLLTSPLFWFYGEIALPHALDALLVTVGAWGLYEVMQGRKPFLYPTIAVIAIAGGLRQQTLIFLMPVLLFALRRVGWRRFFGAGVLGAVVCLAWFVPLMTASGGVSEYFRVTGAYTRRFQSTTSVFLGAGWWGVRRNVVKLVLYTAYGWSLAAAPLGVSLIDRLCRRDRTVRWERVGFLALWIGPSLLYYALVHMGQQGLVFVFLPALLLISAEGVDRLWEARAVWGMVAVGTILAINSAIFCLVPEYPLGEGGQRLLTREAVEATDAYYGDRFEAIRKTFPPDATAIVAASWHHVEYYLPEYVVLPFDLVAKREKGAGDPLGNPDGDAIIRGGDLGLDPEDGEVFFVVFDPALMDFVQRGGRFSSLPLARGDGLSFWTLGAEEGFHYGTESFGVDLE